MRKQSYSSRKLRLAKETIRQMLPSELLDVAAGFSCGTGSACGCSGGGDPFTLANCDTLGCTRPQY